MNRREMLSLISRLIGTVPATLPSIGLACKGDRSPGKVMKFQSSPAMVLKTATFSGVLALSAGSLRKDPYDVDCLDSLTLASDPADKVNEISVELLAQGFKPQTFQMKPCHSKKLPKVTVWEMPDSARQSEKLFTGETKVTITAVAKDKPEIRFVRAPC